MIHIDSINRVAIRLMLAAVIGAAGLNQAIAAQTASVVAKASKLSMQVAEPFSLELVVTAPAGAKVTFPSTNRKLGDFDVVDMQDLFDIPDATTADARTWTRRMTLESVVTGDLSVPAIEIQVSGSGGWQVIRSNPIAVQVVSVLENRGDPTQFRDIQKVVDVELSKIVRDYLQLQFKIPESGRTAQELVQLIDKQLNTDITNHLRELFSLADKAKFAGLELSPEGLKSVVNDSRKLVERIADEIEAKACASDATENQ